MCQAGPTWHVLAAVAMATCAACAGDRPAAAVSGTAVDAGEQRAAPASTASIDASAAGPRAATLALIPRPRTTAACNGSLAVDGSTEIVVDDDPDTRAVGLRLAQWLGIGATLVRAIPVGAPGPAHAIILRLEPASSAPGNSRRDPAVEPPRDIEDEAYTLDISTDRALLRARHPAGLFYGAQTLAQLAGARAIAGPGASLHAPTPHALPCVRIDDGPTQRVRAMHLDVARHFFSKELVERYVDILAFYRFNVFHWHLTDDQGFRLTIRSHPELTQVGGRRIEDGREHAGSYTQDEAREVVAWAKARFITVVPEVEMPGHARAILASHPELSCNGKKQEVPSTWGVFDDVLCAGNEATFTLLGDILRETTEVFPSRLVHIGGDEVPKVRWNACPKCRARMAKEKLDAEQLQGAFLKRAGALLAARGRRVLAWDEALDGGLAKDGIVVAWQSAERGKVAALAGHDVVMAPSSTTYFNYWQSRGPNVQGSARPKDAEPGHEGYLPWTKVLAFDPVPPGLDAAQKAHILGGEGALWTEHIRTSEELDTMLMPRLAALSDALWSLDARDEASFASRFAGQRAMLDASRVQYFVEPPVGLRPRKVFLEATSLVLAPPAIHPEGVVRFTLDGTDPTATSPVFNAPIELRATTAAAVRLFLPGGRASAVARGQLEREALRPPIQPSMDPSMLREGVLYKYYESDFHKLPDFATLKPKRTGRLSSLSFDPAFRAERFAVIYDAWIRVPADGVYRFVTHADDGVTVDVDGVRVLVDDGEHYAHDADGEIALERGPHTIRIGYFQGGGGKALALSCEGPSMKLGPCIVVSP